MKTFEEILEEYWQWASMFDVTSQEACNGLIREAKELQEEYWNQGDSLDKLVEMSDVLFYLIYILRKDNMNLDSLKVAMSHKLGINSRRTWTKNPDGTYSHIKD